jgi:hypothetical protein
MKEGRGGFTDVARELSEHYQLDPPMKRQQIERWYRRQTRNADGRAFPQPVERGPLHQRRPYLKWDYGQVLEWTRPGVPNPHSRHGFRQLGGIDIET